MEAWTWLAPCCRDDGLRFYHCTVGPFDGARPFALVFGLSDFGGFGTEYCKGKYDYGAAVEHAAKRNMQDDNGL